MFAQINIGVFYIKSTPKPKPISGLKLLEAILPLQDSHNSVVLAISGVVTYAGMHHELSCAQNPIWPCE